MKVRDSSQPHPPYRVGAIPTFEFGAVEAAVLHEALSKVTTSPYVNLEDFLEEVDTVVAPMLPRWLRKALSRFKNDPAGPGAILLRGVPIDRNPGRTPRFGEVPTGKPTFVSEGMLLAIARLLGEPIGYFAEKEGFLPHQVVGVAGFEKHLSNQGWNIDFKFHTEIAWHALRPNFLALIWLRPDPRREAATVVSEAREAVHLIDAEALDVLWQPRFRTPAPLSFREAHGNVLWSEAHAPLSGPRRLPELRVDLNTTKALEGDDEAAAALVKLAAALNDPSIAKGHHAEAGDLLLISNVKAVHGRTPFLIDAHGYDRWAQRTYGVYDVWCRRTAPTANPRIF